MPVATIEEIQSKVGSEIGVSDWILIDQARIDAFADITEDHQFIHVDPERAAKTPFRGTVAHGFLTLSLLSRMADGVMLHPESMRMAVNYGFEKVRFMAPVRSGKRIRGRFRMLSAEEKRASQWQITYEVTVEIEDEEKPALVADWIGYMFI
jgi:acyl dehydratase